MNSFLNAQRLEQILSIGESSNNFDGEIVVHGSIARAALMGKPMPSLSKFNGTLRDIDVYMFGKSTKEVDDYVSESGLDTPCPVDAGFSDIFGMDTTGKVVMKAAGLGISVNEEVYKKVFDTQKSYVEGIGIITPTPLALYCMHALTIGLNVRPDHVVADVKAVRWLEKNTGGLPSDVVNLCNEMQAEYRAKYPGGVALKAISQVYRTTLPESIRTHTRHFFTPLMASRTGR